MPNCNTQPPCSPFGQRNRAFRRILTAVLTTVILTGGAAAATPPGDAASERKPTMARPEEQVPVAFITLRNKTDDSDPEDTFGGRRDRLRTGHCTVKFSPIWGLQEIAGAAPFYIPDETSELTEVHEIPEDRFWEEIDAFTQRNDGNIVLYIHGYNVGFAKSCRRAALFQRALGLHDRLLLFSWPADGNLLKYTWDESDLLWSVHYLKQVIDKIAARVGDGRLDIVAHSLGARGAVQALSRMTDTTTQRQFIKELVLVAPDIDTDVFQQQLPSIRGLAHRITIYVSDRDKALRVSREVHGYPRLGQAGEDLTVLEGVETIDISGIAARRFSGHIYHLFNPAVIDDLTILLNTGQPAQERPSLTRDTLDGRPFWRMAPQNDEENWED